eukprot:scaffold7055_cov254-Pinguiococcus_pyrenoidosus.AAC.21
MKMKRNLVRRSTHLSRAQIVQPQTSRRQGRRLSSADQTDEAGAAQHLRELLASAFGRERSGEGLEAVDAESVASSDGQTRAVLVKAESQRAAARTGRRFRRALEETTEHARELLRDGDGRTDGRARARRGSNPTPDSAECGGSLGRAISKLNRYFGAC